jgi:hypothetical protein
MLEPDIKAVYKRMATVEPPPSRISIPAATRRGRTRMRLRGAGVVGSPLFAAGAVLAIALSGALPAGLLGTKHAPANAGVSGPAAPRYFNPLRPYAAFGWLPDGALRHTAGFFGRTELSLVNTGVTRGPVALFAFTAGICHLSGRTVTCSITGGAPTWKLGRPAGRVDGHPAYSATGFPGNSSGSLTWQYARGGWVTMEAPSLRIGLRIARNVRFGPTAGPPVRFPYQLTGVPANWRVNWVGTRWLHLVLYADGFGVTAGTVNRFSGSPPTTPVFDAGPAAGKGQCYALMYYKFSIHTINGYQAFVGHSTTYPWPKWELCANNADGDFVWIAMRGHPAIGVVRLFEHHIRLLGPDPAKWTTKPIN